MQKFLIHLGGWLVVCLAVGFAGSQLTTPQIGTWYATLNKPSFNPPNWVFGPVWTTLYVLMAVSAARISSKFGWRGAVVELAVFLAQLGLNLLWSGLFFAAQRPGWAMLEIAILWLAIVTMIELFSRRDQVAGLLQLPYLLWVSYASVLNFWLWRMN
ncbi:MAG: TspO/MBR family protein [Pirellulales bacterium]|nr:TspO/MBR family protein [Pirellulales bacterium]